MICDEARATFSARFDDELGRAEQMAVDEHISVCDECERVYSDYVGFVEGIGPALRQAVDSERPQQPFLAREQPADPASGRRLPRSSRYATSSESRRWVPRTVSVGQVLRPVVWGLAAATLAVAIVDYTQSERRAEDRFGERPQVEARTPTASSPVALVAQHAPSCEWYDAKPEELVNVASYPVVTEDCGESGLELVHAKLQSSEPCPDKAELTYASGDRTIVLEQMVDTAPECCNGEHVLLGYVMGCLQGDDGVTSLRWSQEHHRFHLRGEIPVAEAVQFAQSISNRFVP